MKKDSNDEAYEIFALVVLLGSLFVIYYDEIIAFVQQGIVVLILIGIVSLVIWVAAQFKHRTIRLSDETEYTAEKWQWRDDGKYLVLNNNGKVIKFNKDHIISDSQE